MKILFISANREEINMPVIPVGMGCVAMAARMAGHEAKMIDLLTEPDVLSAVSRAVDHYRPDVIAISVRNIDDQNMADPKFLLDQAKTAVSACRGISRAPIVIGGAGYSIFPNAALTYLDADIGIQGEGEQAFPELLRRIQSGRNFSGLSGVFLKTGGLQGKRSFEKTLDMFPFPDPDFFRISDSKGDTFYLPIQTRRGCPLNCSYCSTPAIEGRKIRFRSPQCVLRHLASWTNAGFTKFFFVDNTFNLPSSYAEDLSKQLSRSGLPVSWRCILYPGKASGNLIEAMSRGGCKEVSLGFESGCQKVLDGFNKRFTLDDIRRTSKILADCGIRQMGFLLLGGPDETKQSVLESLEFVESLPLDVVRITAGIRIYPGTRIAAIAAHERKVPFDDDLLNPVFYMKNELSGWLRQTLEKWAVTTRLSVIYS